MCACVLFFFDGRVLYPVIVFFCCCVLLLEAVFFLFFSVSTSGVFLCPSPAAHPFLPASFRGENEYEFSRPFILMVASFDLTWRGMK